MQECIFNQRVSSDIILAQPLSQIKNKDNFRASHK